MPLWNSTRSCHAVACHEAGDAEAVACWGIDAEGRDAVPAAGGGVPLGTPSVDDVGCASVAGWVAG
jgi:hypothetical protein